MKLTFLLQIPGEDFATELEVENHPDDLVKLADNLRATAREIEEVWEKLHRPVIPPAAMGE
jgi:hypothetical protein